MHGGGGGIQCSHYWELSRAGRTLGHWFWDLGSSEMLSSDHTHSVDRTRHQTQSLGMTSAALAKGAAGG